MKEINLEKILDQYYLEKKAVLLAMKEACKQSIELANENVHERRTRDGNVEYYIQNKNSILNTINQIK